jgi:hypothetical protein
MTLIDLARGGRPVNLEFTGGASARAKRLVQAHARDPGSIQAGFKGGGASNETAGQMLAVALVVALDGTVSG